MPRAQPPRFPLLYDNELTVVRNFDWRPFLKTLTIASIDISIRPSSLLTLSSEAHAGGIAQCLATTRKGITGEGVFTCKAVLSNGEVREVEVLQEVLRGGDY